MLHNSDVRSAFKDFLREESKSSSNKAPSYVRALDLLGSILARKGKTGYQFSNVWEITNPDTIRKLYEYVGEHRKKGETGIFTGEEPRSYWEKGFMSAALRSYLEFRVMANHQNRLWDIFKSRQDLAPEELSRHLHKQDVEAIEPLSVVKEAEGGKREGKDVRQVVKTRVNQDLFRRIMLDTYRHSCCLTGIGIDELLVASHIVSWSEDAGNRLNPRNGLCLNALHDKAFDKGLISFDDNLCLLVSGEIEEHFANQTIEANFASFEGKPISLPEQFTPAPEFLAEHRKASKL